MKSKMKKMMALFLAFVLAFIPIGDIAQVKAADYTDVTLTKTDEWNTSYDGTNNRWVLYLNTSGYTSTDWAYKYQGFTIEYNGVIGKSDQVSSADGSRLYCTIPSSLVPATDGAVFTIKAGQYAPDDAGTTTGINITEDFTVVAVDGRLVHTQVIDEDYVEAFNHSADSFYFALKNFDATGETLTGITTGKESWDNFLSPAYCDGTRIDRNGWASTYTGIFINGVPAEYLQWGIDGVGLKNVEQGIFYLELKGLIAEKGTNIKVRGLFASTISDSVWTLNGHFFIKELNFTYDGSVWSVSRPVEYKTVTLTETEPWITEVKNGSWCAYLNTSNFESTNWNRKYESFNYECNGVSGKVAEVSAADSNRLYFTVPTSEVSADSGTVFTIKAGEYAPTNSNTRYGIRITEDFDIVVVENRLAHTQVIRPATVEAFNTGNETPANAFYFSLKDAEGNGIGTGMESWDNFLTPSWCDGTRVTAADWSNVYSGVFVDDESVVYAGWNIEGGNAEFKNPEAGIFYVGGLNAVKGTTVVVRGMFCSSDLSWTLAGDYFLPELTFTYDGSAWTYVDNSSIIEHTGTPVFDHCDNNLGFYFSAGETAFPYDADNWTIIATAEEDDESGVFIDGEKTDVYLKKVNQDLWYVCMNDAGVAPEEGTEIDIVIAGTFIYQNHRITFEEAEFTFNGTAYEGPSANYTGTPELLEIEKYGSAAGFYFKAGDGAPALGWGPACAALDGDANGVFINGEKTEINLKKTNTDEWYVCISDAGVTLNEEDVLTIKGSFQMGTTADTVTFTEKDFVFNGKRFSDGKFTATDFTITGLAYSDIVYDEANSRWNMYFTLSNNIPGDIDQTYYPYMTYKIGDTEYTTPWFKSSSAHIVGGETIYNLYFPIEALPQTLEQEYVITVQAGTQQGRVSGTNAAREDGINLTADYQFVVGGDYQASAPVIDYTIGNGGNESGIYLSSGDAFPTIGWDYNLTKTGDTSGIYVNDAATDVFIKKYEDNKYYVCLSDSGITATEGTIVMLKGSFTTKGLNTVTFKTAKYIYTDGQWKVYTATVEIQSTGVWGDATGKDNLNSQDLVRVKLYLANETKEIGLYDADLNASGNIDTYDTYMIRRLLVDDEYFRNGYNVDGAPTYEDNQEMRLAAYVAPEYDADTIASALADYAAAGFTTVIGENRAVYDDVNLDAYMTAAKTAGLDVLVQDGSIQTMAEGSNTYNANVIAEHFNELLKYDNFRGLFMGDEPEISQLENYTAVMNTLNSLNAQYGKDMFIAHHPLYTDESYLWDDTSLSLDEKYTKYAEAFGGLFGEYMYDYYPFRYSTQWGWYDNTIKRRGNYMREEWFYNLTLAATASKGKVPTGITVQSYAENVNSSDHYRSVTEADVSFQVYSALAYGMKSISYFTYDEHWDSNVGTTDCMIYNGQKTGIYTAVQKVNKEIKAIDHIMLNFNWQGTIGFSKDNSDSIMNYVGDYTSKRISTSSATNDAIIGCLKDLNGYDGFMLVNATDPSDNKSATVDVTFNDADHAKVYIDGVESIVELTNGAYSATLAPGEGIFVIPYIAE